MYLNDEEERMNEINLSGQNPAGYIWAQIMKAIHTNLPNKNFSQPNGIVSASICKASGCIATTGCTDVYTDIFTADNMPETCQGHGAQEICEASGKLANEYCPREQVKTVGYGAVILKEQLKLWNTLTPSASAMAAGKVEGICDIHTKPIEVPEEKPTKPTNTTNTTGDTNTSENTNSSTGNNTTSGGEGGNNTGNTTPDQNVTN